MPDAAQPWRRRSAASSLDGTPVDSCRCTHTTNLSRSALWSGSKRSFDKAGDALGLFSRRVEKTVQEFKKFIESRTKETGAWRGEIDHGRRVR
jgi:hypothetical protein